MTHTDDKYVSFGFQDIESQKKAGMVQNLFSDVAQKYDLMNDVMSAGLHRLWKDKFVSLLSPNPHKTYLDMAGGTGDIALRIAKKRGTGKGIVVGDLTYNMLEQGLHRKDIFNDDIERICLDAENLPFEDNSFDGYTISYGIRNVTFIDKVLLEAYRTLKSGGKFMCLEFSMPTIPAVKTIYDAYSFNLLPKMGQIISGDSESYRYLAESIRRFPVQQNFMRMMGQAGFKNISHTVLSGGITTIYMGYKISL